MIDWTRGADEIARKVRAFNPWPVAETRLNGEQLRIHAACVASAEYGSRAATGALGERTARPGIVGADPGTIALTHEGEVLVTCGAGALVLMEVQRPGRRPISGRDFAKTPALAGHRLV